MQSLITQPTVSGGLRQMGIRPGATLLVHCRMSSLGHVQGGAQTLIEALLDQLGSAGTLVMPTFTGGRFDPSEWSNPPVDQALWDRIRFETPAYHPQKTPTGVSMSKLYELFRTWPAVVRTDHPHSSFAAWGQHRNLVVETHDLEQRFGETSPLKKLYDLNAVVLFLGTTYATNTCFHLAEYRQASPPIRDYLIVQLVNGARRLITYQDVDTDSSRFEDIGADFETANPVTIGSIGNARCRQFRLRDAVDFAVNWLDRNG